MFYVILYNFLVYAVNCKWRWGDYTACSVTCGGGTATRYGIITHNAAYGGKLCPPNVVNRVPDTKNCNPDPCARKICCRLGNCNV